MRSSRSIRARVERSRPPGRCRRRRPSSVGWIRSSGAPPAAATRRPRAGGGVGRGGQGTRSARPPAARRVLFDRRADDVSVLRRAAAVMKRTARTAGPRPALAALAMVRATIDDRTRDTETCVEREQPNRPLPRPGAGSVHVPENAAAATVQQGILAASLRPVHPTTLDGSLDAAQAHRHECLSLSPTS